MTQRTFIAAGLSLAFLLAGAQARAANELMLSASQIQAKGATAVLDENADYHVRTLRVQLEPNKELPPHGPSEGYFFATVISGTLELGMGKTFDAGKLQTLGPGSVFSHPPTQQHFARTGAEPVVLQITTIKPPAKDKNGQGGKAHAH